MKQNQSLHLLFAMLASTASVVVSAQTAPTAATGSTAAAATPATLNVTVGGVISPGSCTPGKGVEANLNQINPASLREGVETPIAPIMQTLSIKCDSGDAAIALSVSGTDKAATPSNDALDHKASGIQAEANKGYIYDLVDANDTTKRVGRYVFQFRNFTYTTSAQDAKPLKAAVITSSDRSAWSTAENTAANAAQLKSDGSSFVSFAAPSTPATPVSAKEFTGSIVIGAVIGPLPSKKSKPGDKSDDKQKPALNDLLKFMGTTTITLSYL